MKKILLALTALATLTTTLYAACTADVDMGNNKITNLTAGTTDGEAVNYEQAVKRTQALSDTFLDVNETVTVHSYSRLQKSGKTVCLTLLANVSDTSQKTLLTTPEGFRPAAITYSTFNGYNNDKGAIDVWWYGSGLVVLKTTLPSTGYIAGSICGITP